MYLKNYYLPHCHIHRKLIDNRHLQRLVLVAENKYWTEELKSREKKPAVNPV